MDLGNNTILITGGSTGIGYALAERFIKAGSEVIVCGRRDEALNTAKNNLPGLHTYNCDVASEAERKKLFEWVTEKFPKLNVLVNNAGIQRRKRLSTDEPWSEVQNELAINLEAPLHLANLFIPHLLKVENPAIINVTSGLAFVPMTLVPVYSATKAALHSYTLSLRQNLADGPIKVIEVIPPAVNTDLGGAGLHTMGVPLDEFTGSVIPKLEKGELEIAYGFSEKSSRASREELDQIFAGMNSRKE
jgi:uncharacterized oxidoreductase